MSPLLPPQPTLTRDHLEKNAGWPPENESHSKTGALMDELRVGWRMGRSRVATRHWHTTSEWHLASVHYPLVDANTHSMVSKVETEVVGGVDT